MTTAVVKTSKEVKATTSMVSQHLDAVGRAREIYLQAIKRAEAHYFERIEQATQIITGNGAADEQVDSAQQPASEPATASPAA